MKEQIWSADDENFIYDSLQELIEDLADIEAGCVVSVGDKHVATVSTLVDAGDIIEMLGERAYDNFGEAAEDFPDVTKEAEDELNLLLQQWVDKHCSASFYWIKGVKPYVITEDDIKESLP